MRTPTPPSSPSELPLVERLRASTKGRYQIHAELGVGGMATVFRATEIALEREVAIKVMSTAMSTTPGAFERFRREARVAAALSHPHIVPIYAIGEDPALAWFAMKFIEGRGLDSILKKEGAQSIETVTHTIAVVGRALHHAHEKGVVHRDVKPANIMVGSDGWTYVTDFGIAKRDDVEGLTQAGTVIGTPAYMSPEQFNGAAITGAADQYSLGVVAFEMLAGRAPFNAPSIGEIMRGHLLEPPPPLRTLRIDVPVAVAECVNRMLEKDPAKRFATLSEAASALEAAGAVAKGGPMRRSVPSTANAAPAAPIVTMGATTPIPRSNPTSPTSGAIRRPVTATHARPVEKKSGGGVAVILFLLLAAAGGGGWYFMQGRATTSEAGAPLASVATPVTTPATTPVVATPGDSSAVEDSTAVAAGPAADTPRDTAPPAPSLESAFENLAARVAAAPVVDAGEVGDSVVVRAGSQMLETVLFINGQQLGIVGGRGLMSATVAPGPVSVSVKKVNCRDWDTTFTGLAGRRYTFRERSPTC